MVRISLGAYNTSDDVDALVDMLERIVRNDYQGVYYQVPESGDYRPVGYEEMLSGDFPPARGIVHGNAAAAAHRRAQLARLRRRSHDQSRYRRRRAGRPHDRAFAGTEMWGLVSTRHCSRRAIVSAARSVHADSIPLR